MNLLAFDTSTDKLSIGVQRASRQWLHAGAGGAQASGTLIPAALRLLDEAGLKLAELDAIAFGRGPGSFTGLRTACAVAQGLAFGAARPVLPIDTLLAVAEDARLTHGRTQVLALLDARMDQVYAQPWAWTAANGWAALDEARVGAPEALALPAAVADDGDGADWVLAGNVFATYGARLPQALQAWPQYAAQPNARALLSVAPGLLATGRAAAAEQALPLYIRDKVAQTTAERAAAAAARSAPGAAP